jgi:ABC-type nitrate/sulfonate/bicarbonate transport system permease component
MTISESLVIGFAIGIFVGVIIGVFIGGELIARAGEGDE